MTFKGINRRSFVLATMSLAVALPGLTISTSEAEKYVNSAMKDLEGLVSTGASPATLSKFLEKYSDIPILARACLGAPWRSLSNAERNAYTKAFQGYLSRKYGSQLAALNGSSGKIVQVKDGGKGGALVTVEFTLAGQAPGRIELQVSDMSGRPKVLDIRNQGVSLIATEREQIRALYNQQGNDINGLVNALNAQ